MWYTTTSNCKKPSNLNFNLISECLPCVVITLSDYPFSRKLYGKLEIIKIHSIFKYMCNSLSAIVIKVVFFSKPIPTEKQFLSMHHLENLLFFC